MFSPQSPHVLRGALADGHQSYHVTPTPCSSPTTCTAIMGGVGLLSSLRTSFHLSNLYKPGPQQLLKGLQGSAGHHEALSVSATRITSSSKRYLRSNILDARHPLPKIYHHLDTFLSLQTSI